MRTTKATRGSHREQVPYPHETVGARLRAAFPSTVSWGFSSPCRLLSLGAERSDWPWHGSAPTLKMPKVLLAQRIRYFVNYDENENTHFVRPPASCVYASEKLVQTTLKADSQPLARLSCRVGLPRQPPPFASASPYERMCEMRLIWTCGAVVWSSPLFTPLVSVTDAR